MTPDPDRVSLTPEGRALGEPTSRVAVAVPTRRRTWMVTGTDESLGAAACALLAADTRLLLCEMETPNDREELAAAQAQYRKAIAYLAREVARSPNLPTLEAEAERAERGPRAE